MGSHAVRRMVKTKRHKRDLDQVKADIRSPRHLQQHKESKAAEDLPGLGAFYCTECAKYFSDSHNLNEHRRGKAHKRR
jgi:bud site selection protein 20